LVQYCNVDANGAAILVSHDMSLILELASSVWLLKNKTLLSSSDVSSAVMRYLGGHKLQKMPKRNLLALAPKASNELGRVNHVKIFSGLLKKSYSKTDVIATTMPISFEVEFEMAVTRHIECQFYCDLYRHGIALGGVRTECQPITEKGTYRAFIEIPSHSLFKGRIQANVGVNLIENQKKNVVSKIIEFDVVDPQAAYAGFSIRGLSRPNDWFVDFRVESFELQKL